jgi:hypothetical protein
VAGFAGTVGEAACFAGNGGVTGAAVSLHAGDPASRVATAVTTIFCIMIPGGVASAKVKGPVTRVITH